MLLWRTTAGSLILFLTGLNSYFRAFAGTGRVVESLIDDLELETAIESRANIKRIADNSGMDQADIDAIVAACTARKATA